MSFLRRLASRVVLSTAFALARPGNSTALHFRFGRWRSPTFARTLLILAAGLAAPWMCAAQCSTCAAQCVQSITLDYLGVDGYYAGVILTLTFQDGRSSTNAGLCYDGAQMYYDISLPTQNGFVTFNGESQTFPKVHVA